MHRTTTTATLLVTVAVSALTGCTTVQRPPAPGPSATPVQPPVPRPDGSSGPQVVQAPAREALEMIGPTRKPAAPQPTPPGRPAAPPATTPPAPKSRVPRSDPPPRADRRAPQPPRRSTTANDLADSIGKDVRSRTDVCALGKQYGGWREDSPESRICEQTYGR